MPVVTEAFDIPMDISTKLSIGEYRRIGGVIRVAVGPKKGQIVKFLEPVKSEQVVHTHNMGVKVFQLVKKNKKGIMIGAVFAGPVVVVSIVVKKIKNKKMEIVEEYYAALRNYIREIRNGELNLKSINLLMGVIEELRQNKNYKKIEIELRTEELNVLVDRIYEYTIKLASDNNVKLTADEISSTNNAIVNLQRNLETQKYIFEITE